MRKSTFLGIVSVIFVQCLSFSGCTSKEVPEDKALPTIEVETEVRKTEIATEFVIIDGDSLEQYTIPSETLSEESVEIIEQTTEQTENSFEETDPSSEPTEAIIEGNTRGFVPGENETPGDPL